MNIHLKQVTFLQITTLYFLYRFIFKYLGKNSLSLSLYHSHCHVLKKEKLLQLFSIILFKKIGTNTNRQILQIIITDRTDINKGLKSPFTIKSLFQNCINNTFTIKKPWYIITGTLGINYFHTLFTNAINKPSQYIAIISIIVELHFPSII